MKKDIPPDFDGINEFNGKIMHPQKWDTSIDYSNKEVIVIGSGATAVTLVPEMAKDAKHVTMLQRSPTYVVSAPQQDPLAIFYKNIYPQNYLISLFDGKIFYDNNGTLDYVKKIQKE